MLASVVESHAATVRELGLAPDLLDADFAAFRVLAESWRGRPASDGGYDALVGQGERWSTRIVSAHLAAIGLPALWVSAWDVIRTDGTHRAAAVDAASVESLAGSARKAANTSSLVVSRTCFAAGGSGLSAAARRFTPRRARSIAASVSSRV